MSEIERMLRRCLEPVAQQRRRLRLYRTLGASWLIAGLLGAALAAAYWLAGWWSPLAVGLLVLATAAAVGAAFLQAVRVGEFDYRALADRIEHRHPELRSLLRTAVEQKAREPDGELGYLQQRVIEQALSHAREHPWDRTVSRTQMTLTGVGQLAAMLLFLATLGMLLAPALPGAGAGGSSASDGEYRIEVEPGDTAVERGESVVVVARFDEAVPADASVVIESADEEAGDEPNDAEPASTEDDGERTPQLSSQQRKRLPLSRNLEDPVLGGTIPEINRDLRYRIEYDGRRSRSYTIRTYAHPALERADARIEPPEHTDREPRTVEDTRHVSAAEGSRLTLKLHLNKPVERARLVAMDDQGEATGRTVAAEPGGADGDETETLSLKPGTEPSPDAVESGTDEPNVYRAAFDLDRSRAYELRLEDAEGRSNKSPPRFTIDVHRNVPPRIELTFPGRDTQVSPLQELPLEAKASDDYGVLGYGLTYSIGGEERTVRLDGGDVETAEAEMRHTLAMERLNAEPGQLLSFHFWAEDRGPDGERRRTAGDLYFAEVRPFERVFREASGGGQQGQQQNQSGMELLQIQKQVMIATWKLRSRHAHSGSGPADGGDTQEAGVIRDSQREALNQARQMRSQVRDEQARSALDEATGRMETALEALGPLADEAPEGEERSTLLEEALTAERGAYQALLKMQGNEHRVTRGQGGGGGGGQRAQRQLSELELTQEDRRYETERQASSQRQRAQEGEPEALQRLRELARRQGDLAERLKELRLALREAETEEEKQELQRRLKRLREQQRQLVHEMDRMQQQMERSENRRRTTEARQRLQEARDRAQRASEAMQREDRLSEAVNEGTRAERQLNDLQRDFRQRSAGRFAEQMRRMREDARALDERQDRIADDLQNGEAEGAQRRRLRDPEGADPEGVADRLDRQSESLGELLDQMRQVTEAAENAEPLLAEKLYDALRRAETDGLRETMQNATELLRNGGIARGREKEREAHEGVERLREDIEAAAERVLGEEAEALRLARSELNDLIEQVQREGAPGERSGSQGGARNGEPGQQRAVEDDPTERRTGSSAEEEGDRRASDSQQPGGASSRRFGDPEGQTREARGRGDGSDAERSGPRPLRGGSGQEAERRSGSGESDRSNPSLRRRAEAQDPDPENRRDPSRGEPPDRRSQASAGGPRQREARQRDPEQRGASQGDPSQQEGASQQGRQGERGQAGRSRGSQSRDSGSQTGAQNGERSRGASQQEGAQQGGSSSQQQEGSPSQQGDSQQGTSRQSGAQQGGAQPGGSSGGEGGGAFFEGWAGRSNGGPFTGGDFREWSDRLEDVGRMLEEPGLRNRVAEVRQRARAVRAAFKRHGEAPKWDVVRDEIMQPLTELRRDVEQRLRRIESDDQAPVPIDRDPVPGEFEELVREYYERLGSGQ